MKYPDDFINKLICGDCLEVMKIMPDNCIETIITDPPYGLKFMGKKWDYKVPSIEMWQECLRILKPGGTALIFAGSRTQHRMAVNVEDAGFILKDVIEELYEPDTQAFYKKLNTDLRKEFLKLMGGNEMFWLYGSGFPKAMDISKQIDKMAGKEREIIGYQDPHFDNCKRTKPRGVGLPNGIRNKNPINTLTAPATPEAKLWNGWKSQGLKPAYEPILVAMKPNEGSYANNAFKWGVAGLNIDGGRIPFKKDDWEMRNQRAGINAKNINYGKHGNGFLQQMDSKYSLTSKGRFPANIIHDGSDEVVRLFPNTGTSYRPNSRRGKIKSEIYMNGIVRDGYPTAIGVNDSGSASRFFYCAKASKAERNRGCEGLEKKERANINKMMGKAGNFKTGSGNLRTVKFKNNHPTVKPLALMKYLCTLTKTPTGGIVLDPFCGSGTTLMACKETGRKYIGIEIEKEYVEIAQCRLGAIEEVLF